MATPINLASASPVVINAWCKSIKVDSLIDLFKSNKIEPAHFFVNSKDAASARKKMLSELGINALQIAAINKNIETTEATFEYDEAVDRFREPVSRFYFVSFSLVRGPFCDLPLPRRLPRLLRDRVPRPDGPRHPRQQEVQNFAQALQRVAAQPQAAGVEPEPHVAQLGGLTIVTRLSTYTYTTVHLPHPSYRWLRRDARRAAAFEVRTHRVGTYEMPPRAQQ